MRTAAHANRMVNVEGEEVMGKLIEAEILMAKAKIEAQGMSEPFKTNFAMLVEWLADKTPEAVVKCRDCKNYEFAGNRVPEEQTWYCYMWDCETGCEDFCSYGERRTDG